MTLSKKPCKNVASFFSFFSSFIFNFRFFSFFLLFSLQKFYTASKTLKRDITVNNEITRPSK